MQIGELAAFPASSLMASSQAPQMAEAPSGSPRSLDHSTVRCLPDHSCASSALSLVLAPASSISLLFCFCKQRLLPSLDVVLCYSEVRRGEACLQACNLHCRMLSPGKGVGMHAFWRSQGVSRCIRA